MTNYPDARTTSHGDITELVWTGICGRCGKDATYFQRPSQNQPRVSCRCRTPKKEQP